MLCGEPPRSNPFYIRGAAATDAGRAKEENTEQHRVAEQLSYGRTQASLSKTLEKLASGYRINRAVDNAEANAGGRTGTDTVPAAAYLSGRSAAPAAASGADRAAVPTTEAETAIPAALTVADSAAPVSEVAALSAAPRAAGVTCGDFTVYGDASSYSFDGATGVLTIKGDVTVESNGVATQHNPNAKRRKRQCDAEKREY